MPPSYIMIASRPKRMIRRFVLLHLAIGLRGEKQIRYLKDLLLSLKRGVQGDRYASLWLVEFE